MSRKLLAGLALAATLAAGCAGSATAQDPAKLNDLEIAHAAYVAGDIDIRNAHLALALSDDPKVREFAGLMIRDHEISINTGSNSGTVPDLDRGLSRISMGDRLRITRLW